MTAAILNVVLGVIGTVAVLAVLPHAILRTRREPRRRPVAGG